MVTRVVDSHTRFDYDVYIGRGSIWGNDHANGFLSKREAVARYRRDLQSRPDLLARLHELKDKALGCPCGQRGGVCHGYVLVELIDGPESGT